MKTPEVSKRVMFYMFKKKGQNLTKKHEMFGSVEFNNNN